VIIMITMIAMLRYEQSWSHTAGRAMKKGKGKECENSWFDLMSVHHRYRVPVDDFIFIKVECVVRVPVQQCVVRVCTVARPARRSSLIFNNLFGDGVSYRKA